LLALPTTGGGYDLAPMLEDADALWVLHGDLSVQQVD
jgi:hypothetical protein